MLIQWNPLISRPLTSRFPVISCIVLWKEFVPSLYVLEKKAVQVASIPQNSIYKSRLGFHEAIFNI